MDVTEIKQAFIQTNEWEKQADEFRKQRIMDVRSKQYIPNIDIDGSTFIHFIPLGKRNHIVDLKKHQELLRGLQPLHNSSYGYRFNADGHLISPSHHEICQSYNQYFRNGIIEIYSSTLHYKNEKKMRYSGGQLELATLEYIKRLIPILNEIGVELPLILYISILDLLNYSIAIPSIPGMIIDAPDHNNFDRDDLLLPGLVIESYDLDFSELLMPIFNIFWQSSGWPGSPLYKDGKRINVP